MRVYATRESVAAADDVDAPHAHRFELAEDWSWDDLVRAAVGAARLPSVAGGRATWALASNVPLAVVAQQWAAPELLVRLDSDRERLDVVDGELRLHWTYFAQRDPAVVLEVLRRLRLRAVVG